MRKTDGSSHGKARAIFVYMVNSAQVNLKQIRIANRRFPSNIEISRNTRIKSGAVKE